MKKLIFIIMLLLYPLVTFGQDKKQYNTICNVGYSFNNNLSLSIGGRFYKSLYINLDHYINLSSKYQSNYIGFGLGNEKNIVLLKYGVKTETLGYSHINKMDYGIEYNWFYDKKYTYGLAFTKHNGIQFKLGFTL